MKKKRTEITIAIDEITLVNRNTAVSVWCSECSAIVALVPPERAAAIAGVTVRTINRWVEAEIVHFLETENGLLLLCVNSLK